MKLEPRKREDGGREGIYFYAYSDSGKKYSVVNIGKLMETDPSYTAEQWKKYWANTWEALEIIDEKLQTSEEPFKASSWEELEKLLVEKVN